MHKHIGLLQLIALTLVVGVGLYIATLPEPDTQPDRNTQLHPLSLNTPAEQIDFTTIVASGVSSSQPPVKEPPEKIPSSSDILARIDVEEQEYIALIDTNDPLYPAWHLSATAVPQAWDITTGNQDVVIAVIDSGFAFDHQDLSGGWFINNQESGQTTPADLCWDGQPADKQTNNCDDDDNGYIDDWRGWDFYSGDNSPAAGETDPNGDGVTHGTLVSGLIGAASNNSIGIAGVDWSAQIMPLQTLSDRGIGYTSDIVAAIEYAVDNGANVINLSLGGAGHDPAMEAAISYAYANDVIVVVASGNCASLAYSFCEQLPAPGRMTYPSVYDQAIAVGAVNSSGLRASFSGYGPELDVVAPGLLVENSTSWSASNPTSRYASNISGTSFAAPITSGVIGLLLSTGDFSSAQVHQLLRSSASLDIFNPEYGHGSVNAQELLLSAQLFSQIDQRVVDEPMVEVSSGTDPANPIAASGAIEFVASSPSGDELSLVATEITTGAQVVFDGLKTDELGQVNLSTPAEDLGEGAWRVIPSSLQLSGQQIIIYIGQ
ncbi:MAG: S8 family serine peptidase [Patescibacteria group bacterium]